MSDKKVYSKPGLFGKTILYNDKGQVIGSGTPISSKTTVYTDTSGNYLGKSYSGSGSSANLIGADGSVAKGRGGYPGGVTKYVGKDEKPVSTGSGSTETESAKPAGLFSFWRKKAQAKPVPEPDSIKAENYNLSKTPQGWFITKYTGADVQQLSIPAVIAGKPIVGINENAFFGRDALEDVLVPEGIEVIRFAAFAFCRNLKRVHLPDTLKELGSRASGEKTGTFGVFREDRALCEINLPDSLTCIGPSAFLDCTSLQTPPLPDSITEIGDMAFKNCLSLRSVHLPKAIREIPRNAFTGCLCLKQIYIPKGVERIESSAFMACKALERVYIPDTVTSFGMSTQRDGVPHLDYTIFDQCRRVHIYCRPASAAHLLLRRTRIKHSLLVSWPETEPLE